MFQLKFENDWLFKQKKQPWHEFKKILLQNGFPEDITIKQISKKWTYTYDMYKLAKKSNNKEWKYYKLFNKYCKKSKNFDKYESWDDEWRFKLITCISEAKRMKVDIKDLWRTVEMAMRCQDLPLDCCIQDMKGLWRHIRLMFNRKYRAKYDKTDMLSDWPLYLPMYEYYTTFENGHLEMLETANGPEIYGKPRKSRELMNTNGLQNDGDGFHWTKDITESFIQIRLQNDALFKDKKWNAWSELCKIMVEEYGFPNTLNGRDMGKKFAATYREYQKAKATKNKSWLYYDLFELYLGEGNLSLNPTLGWTEESLLNLIQARTEMEHIFRQVTKDNETDGWREIEKRLRIIGLPLDHSLLDLPDIWTYLVKTFRWKHKFASQGILTEQWPYYDAMARYNEVINSNIVKTKEEKLNDSYEDAYNDDDYEDDMRLFDLKQKIKPKLECLEVHQCRSCSSEEGCVNIFEQRDQDGLNLAEKLKIIGGVQVDKSDQLPTQICLTCLQELESAYKFRRRCQDVDKQHRIDIIHKVKIELPSDEPLEVLDDDTKDDHHNEYDDIDVQTDMDISIIEEENTKQEIKDEKHKTMPVKKKKSVKKYRYEYRKICEICGKHTKNLVAHLDMHATEKMYSCDICHKKFKFKSGLVIHKAVHEDTPRKTCEVCGKKFHVLAQYRRHFVYHANERKYECETCGKRFNTIDILRVHHRIHTDERPFKCDVCNKTFRTAGCVTRHKRIVHRILPKSQ